jgi:hypothetical protein
MNPDNDRDRSRKPGNEQVKMERPLATACIRETSMNDFSTAGRGVGSAAAEKHAQRREKKEC